MKLLKLILTGIVSGCFMTSAFASSSPSALKQLESITGVDLTSKNLDRDLSGAELENLKNTNYFEYTEYLTDRCSAMLRQKSIPEIESALKQMEKQDPAKHKAYLECFQSHDTITPSSYEELSAQTKEQITDLSKERIGIGDSIHILMYIGSTIINVIKGGQIVHNNAYGCVWPKGADWRYFTWNKQAVYVFNYKKTILFGKLTAIDSTIVVSYKYDGKYKGRGQYLGNIQVVAEKVKTAFSHSISVTAELPPSSVENLNPQNPFDPVGAVDLNLSYIISWMFPSQKLYRYQIQGYGKLIDKDTGQEPFPAHIIDLKHEATGSNLLIKEKENKTFEGINRGYWITLKKCYEVIKEIVVIINGIQTLKPIVTQICEDVREWVDEPPQLDSPAPGQQPWQIAQQKGKM